MAIITEALAPDCVVSYDTEADVPDDTYCQNADCCPIAPCDSCILANSVCDACLGPAEVLDRDLGTPIPFCIACYSEAA